MNMHLQAGLFVASLYALIGMVIYVAVHGVWAGPILGGVFITAVLYKDALNHIKQERIKK